MTMMVGWQPGDDEVVAGLDEACLPPPIPEDLRWAADVPPAALLLAAGPATLPGQWVDAGMNASFAHVNQVTLEQSRWILETSRAQADTSERVTGRVRAGKIVAASLGWSEGYAAQRIEFARQILERLPALGRSMAEGRLEERKALIFTTTLADLSDAQARIVVDRLLQVAPKLPFQALRAKVEATAEAVDPAWADARRAAAIARRRVTFRVAPSGATELCGLDLPEEPAQDSHDRIVALGRAVARRLRRVGIDAPVGPIESEVMLTLTGPEGAGLWDTDVVDHVLERFGGPADGCSGPDDGGDGSLDDGPQPEPDDSSPTDEPGPDDGPGLDDELEPDDGPDCDPGAGGGDQAPGEVRSAWDSPADVAVDPAGVPNDLSVPTGLPSPRGVVPFVPRVALRLGLRTVLGLDRRPGILPGRGPVVAKIAVSMAWARAHGTWRVLLYDPSGALEHVLPLRPPCHGPPPAGGRRRHHVVEVTAYTAELDALGLAPGPARLPADAQPRADEPSFVVPPGTSLVPGDALTLLERAARALARARRTPAEEHPARTLADAGRRFPCAALRAWVQSRDRTCRSSGCSADAVTCDVDHTRPVEHGGRTVASDLGPFCRRDHTFKHDPTSGWQVHQTSPGHFEWTSPTGRLHHVVPESYDPLPDPVPRADGRPSIPGGLLDPPSPEPGSPRRNRHGFLTRAALDTAGRLRRRAGSPEPDTPTESVVDRWPDEPPF